MIEKIGTNAGLVWHALEAGKLELKAIKKATKLTEKEIYAALGWLARENKVAIAEEGKEVFDAWVLRDTHRHHRFCAGQALRLSVSATNSLNLNCFPRC